MITSQSKKRIVIADDHAIVREGIRKLVERPDRVVVGEAGDGEEALRLILAEQPDLAILDYSLPFLNGVQVIRKSLEELPDTQMLLYTMHDMEEAQLEALRAGARGYVLKSDPAEVLVAAVHSLLLRKPYFSPSISEALLDNFLKNADRPRQLLTDRELEVLKLIAEGYTNKRAAEALGISVKTVETHRASIQRKVGTGSTADIVRYAIRNAIIEP